MARQETNPNFIQHNTIQIEIQTCSHIPLQQRHGKTGGQTQTLYNTNTLLQRTLYAATTPPQSSILEATCVCVCRLRRLGARRVCEFKLGFERFLPRRRCLCLSEWGMCVSFLVQRVFSSLSKCIYLFIFLFLTFFLSLIWVLCF